MCVCVCVCVRAVATNSKIEQLHHPLQSIHVFVNIYTAKLVQLPFDKEVYDNDCTQDLAYCICRDFPCIIFVDAPNKEIPLECLCSECLVTMTTRVSQYI